MTTAWTHLAGGQWAVAATNGQPDLAAQRAILLGLRPSNERGLTEPFALLRGLTVLELVRVGDGERLRRWEAVLAVEPRC
jgi:hypothetical protein